MKISDYVESQIKGLWGTDFDENGISVIKTNNLTYEGHIDYSDICKRNITEEQAKGWYLKPGDLLIEKSGGTKTHSVGYVSYFEGEEDKFVCNNFILALRPKNTINSKFLFYQIQFKYESNQFSDCFNKTTGIQNLKVKDYLAKEIKIYSPEKQEKIVKELDTVRSIINKNKQILKKYDTLIKSRFIEMFGTEKDFNKWPCCKVQDIANVLVGVVIKPTQYYCEKGVPTFRSLNVGELYVNDSDWVYFTEEGNTKNKKSILKENDVLVVRSGAPGKSCVITKKYEGYNAVDVIIAHPNLEKINPVFLSMFTNMPHGMNQIKAKTGGAAQQHFNVGGYNSLNIILPPLKLQNDFASFVQQIDKSKFAVQKSLEKAETLYKSLMQEYFG